MKYWLIFLLAILAVPSPARADLSRADVEEVQKTVVFLGVFGENKEPVYRGTGFFVRTGNFYQLVTAKHVVMEFKDGRFTGNPTDEGLFFFLNNKNGNIGARSLQILKQKYGLKWIFHEDPSVDLAVIPLLLDRDIEEFKTIPESLFLEDSALYETQQVFYLSYQLGVRDKVKIAPIFRQGMISLKNSNKSFFVDGFAFPGNSGSPVFLMPQPLRFADGGVSIGDKLGGKFIGVIGQYVTYNEVAVSSQTLRPRVVFEENVGLSQVWSADLLRELMASDAFKNQMERLGEQLAEESDHPRNENAVNTEETPKEMDAA